MVRLPAVIHYTVSGVSRDFSEEMKRRSVSSDYINYRFVKGRDFNTMKLCCFVQLVDVSVSTHLSACLNSEDVLNVCEKSIESRTMSSAKTTTNTAMAVKRYFSNYKTTEEIRRANSESGLEFKRRKKYIKRLPNNSQNIAFGKSEECGRNVK